MFRFILFYWRRLVFIITFSPKKRVFLRCLKFKCFIFLRFLFDISLFLNNLYAFLCNLWLHSFYHPLFFFYFYFFSFSFCFGPFNLLIVILSLSWLINNLISMAYKGFIWSCSSSNCTSLQRRFWKIRFQEIVWQLLLRQKVF